MSWVSCGIGGPWIGPNIPGWQWSPVSTGAISLGTMDAAAEKIAMWGSIYWHDGSEDAKTVSSAGGTVVTRVHSPIQFNNAGTTIRVGLQDMDFTTFPGVPDGTFDTYDDLVGGTDTITGAGMHTTTLSNGSKSIAKGDIVAIVWDMQSRGGADSVLLGGAPFTSANFPISRSFTTSWQAPATAIPQAWITADDGTVGLFDGGFIYTGFATPESWTNATNPDERGNRFRLGMDVKVDAIKFMAAFDASNDDLDWDIYTDLSGTPASMIGGARSWPAERGGNSSGVREHTFGFAPVILPRLAPSTYYGVALKATGAGTFTVTAYDANQFWAQHMTFGGEVNKITRNNGAGTFSSTSGTVYGIWLRVSHIWIPHTRSTLILGM